jgi:hypothetical protein
MTKHIVCYFLILCSFMLCGMDDDKTKKDDENKYALHLKNGKIKVEKQLLDKFPGRHTLLSGSFTRSYTVNAFQLAMDVAQIMSPDIFQKSLPQKINFETKSKIVQKLEKSLLPDILGCKKIFFHLQQSDTINKFLNQETVRLLKNSFFQLKEDEGINLTDVEDFEDETNALKNEIVRIFATSDQISDFSQQNVHLDLSGTKDENVLREIMVPHGTLYAYTITGDQPMTYLFNLAGQKKIDYASTISELLMTKPVSSFYVAQFANKIVGLTSSGFTLSFSDKNYVDSEYVEANESDKKSLSGDGKFFLMMSATSTNCFLYVHDLINKRVVMHTDIAYISKSGKLRGCCFNPEDSNTFLYYTDEEVCIGDEQYIQSRQRSILSSQNMKKPMILNDFDGEIIKAAFSDDGSCIYVLTWQTPSLTCYKYHYLEQVGKVKIELPNKIDIVNVVNSFDNDQLFVECTYVVYPYRLYDLIRFDFGREVSKYSAHNLAIGAGRPPDVRSLGNLIVYRAQTKIQFYDSFFRKLILYPFGLDRCRSILGFSADKLLWFRIESLADSKNTSKKSADDYLLCYTVQKSEELEKIWRKIEKDFDLNDCLELLKENKDNRMAWYKNAYGKLNKDVEEQKSSLKKSDIYGKAYKKAALLQSTQSEQTKAVIETKKSLQRAQEERKRQQEKLVKLKALEERKKKQQQDDARNLKTIKKKFGEIPKYIGKTPQPPQIPQPTFVQRMWLNIKSAGKNLFYWLFGF